MVLNPDEVVVFFSANDTPSNHYEGGFMYKGMGFRTVEHFLMAKKADLFGDTVVRDQILRTRKPQGAKKLGRQVQGFNNETWFQWAAHIMGKGKILQAEQNPIVLQYYLEHSGKLFIEASPYDDLWGIKLAKDHPDVLKPNKWRGLNLCGYVNTEVARYLGTLYG